MNLVLSRLGRRLAGFLATQRHVHGTTAPTPPERLLACLRPGDVLLVEGHSRVSTAVKFLTNSTWSHAALFVGEVGRGRLADAAGLFVEADLAAGVRGVGLEEFAGHATRICRPVGLSDAERRAVCEHAIARIGHRYDLKNLVDLARYLLPTPPVPQRFRRRMIALGSGDPTRAICSSLIAEAFGAIRYPILPTPETRAAGRMDCPDCVEEVLHIRHHSLYAPRDFDVSPYFQIIKPTIEAGFDHHGLTWAEAA